jgi:CheY-like chemotaxis protein
MSKPLRVLVVEDNLINQRIAKDLLKAMGHTGVMVGDGEKALKCLQSLQFDLIMMDVQMPIMDGMQALAAIRAKEAAGAKKTPIIMATAHDDPGEDQRMIKAGADGYLCKPISIDAMQREFARVLGTVR